MPASEKKVASSKEEGEVETLFVVLLGEERARSRLLNVIVEIFG